MSFNKIAELLIPTLSAFIAFYIGNSVVDKGPLVSWSFSGFTLIFSFAIFSYAWFSAQKTGIFDKRFLYLGNWIQTLNKNGKLYVSLVRIEYSILNDGFIVSGESFAADTLNLYANWTSESVAFPGRDQIAFIHRATIVGQIGEVTGLTRMNFTKDGRKYYGGSGYILDDDENVIALNFLFEKRERTMTHSFINKYSIESVGDRRLFISKYVSSSSPPPSVPNNLNTLPADARNTGSQA